VVPRAGDSVAIGGGADTVSGVTVVGPDSGVVIRVHATLGG
jgi:hypothetical protein